MSNTQPIQAEITPFLFARTKLRPPRLRSDTLPRPRLVNTIQRSVANGRLALVSASAGYGKTTLVANAISQLSETKIAWLTLDSEDNELLRFLSAFASALQPVAPLFALEAAGILAGAGRGDQRDATLLGRDVMMALINELFESETAHCIVIDDLHYVTNEAVHAALNFLIERLPPHVTLVIATRHDPSLALSYLRARREMVELRLEELRFTSEETSTLWNQQLGLPLTAEELSTLCCAYSPVVLIMPPCQRDDRQHPHREDPCCPHPGQVGRLLAHSGGDQSRRIRDAEIVFFSDASISQA